MCVAERAGFEPALGYYPKHAVQACDLNRSSTSPGAPHHTGSAYARQIEVESPGTAPSRRREIDFHLLKPCHSPPTFRENQLGAHMQDELNTDTNTAETHPEKEIMPSLEAMLKAAELQAAEHHDAWLRAKAATETMRRRAAEDVDKARKFAVENFASELLAGKER